MSRFEYKVVPAPTRGQRAAGVKGPEGRFAHALSALMNEMAREGWEYQRAETLPCEERQGLTGKTTVFRNLLVFRRLRPQPGEDFPVPTPEHRPVQQPEEMAESAALSLHPEADPGEAPELGPAPTGMPPRPARGLDGTDGTDER